ncbi:hypothetical protein BKA21_003491 [Cellulomonas oligotrophica]|uniref:Uncharacterized protein n=1 Tax=Cellulomonas oligotrophica TaxID=931536 RepID=A0A7Y9FJ50_9CELL|nr:hypothetical protein [Cellulomonas oligotrophica]GIG32850.1 hypothetical protein Col01nite_20090 [Cellulomonas oligotrophica]
MHATTTFEVARRDHADRLARSARARSREDRSRPAADAAGRPPDPRTPRGRHRWNPQEWTLSG